MGNSHTLSLKSEEIITKKKKWNLALNILISVLGISSLFIKFFLVDGVLAFRAFTVDGNLFTTIVSVIVTIVNIKELRSHKESGKRSLYFLQLASAVTEAVIFIVVMVGYLPIFPDDPKITPYHMFCLHVAIPLLAVPRFIFFEKPQGVLRPPKLLIGAIPIGVYGVGVVTAIKVGILPISLVPYSFLDFKSNFLWYFFFALFVIPSFGYLWSWMFYRLNIRASLLWYSPEDLEKLRKARVKALSNFEAVNSAILIVFCAMAVLVITFALMAMSNTAKKSQHEVMSVLSFFILDDYDHIYGNEGWYIEDGTMYKGDIAVGDGTDAYEEMYLPYDESFDSETTIYMQAKDLRPEIAQNYMPYDFVAIRHSQGATAPIDKCGEVLDQKTVNAVLNSEDYMHYEELKVGSNSYYCYTQTIGEDMLTAGTGLIRICFPAGVLTASVKNAELNNDIMVIAVVVAIFAALYCMAAMWIRALEKSVDYLKNIASGNVPEEDIRLGKTLRLSGLERELNVLRDINKE